MIEHRIHPEVASGDPFPGAARPTRQRPPLDWESPHGCYSGVVYIGEMVIGEDGEEEEVLHPVLCRRCHGETA